MTKITIEIKSCKECPHFKTANKCSSDGWDKMEDWVCTKADKKIQGAVEWHEESKIKIPDWCPILDSGVVSSHFSSQDMIRFGNFIRDNYHGVGAPKLISYDPAKYPNGTIEDIFVIWCCENGY